MFLPTEPLNENRCRVRRAVRTYVYLHVHIDRARRNSLVISLVYFIIGIEYRLVHAAPQVEFTAAINSIIPRSFFITSSAPSNFFHSRAKAFIHRRRVKNQGARGANKNFQVLF